MPAQKVNYRTVAKDQQGRRLDNFLLAFMKGVPRSHVYALIRSGQVRVNSRRARADTRVCVNDKIRVPPLRAPTPATGIPSDALCALVKRAVFYRAPKLMALNKPAGLAVHGGARQHQGVIETLNYLFASEEDLGSWHLLYRLDRETTGCLLAVRGADTKQQIQAHWHDDDCRKLYRLLVHGRWPQHRRTLTSSLRKTRQGGEYVMRATTDRAAKQAVTRVRLLEASAKLSLLEAELITGRTHQIRSQCAAAGYPLVGDTKYDLRLGSARRDRHTPLALHCYKIELPRHLPLPRHEFGSPSSDFDELFQANLRKLSN